MPSQLPVGWEALDELVVAIPVHVLYFDGGLICRYAAPAGSHFLGKTAQQLLGGTVESVFPTELPLATHVVDALATQHAWLGEGVPYPPGPGSAWEAGTWTVHVRPWTLGDDSPRSQPSAQPAAEPSESGVLVSCLPCQAIPAEAELSTDEVAAEGEQIAVLVEGIRTQLTVIQGFASLLRRRLQREGTVDPALTHIGLAATALHAMVEHYEQRARLRLHHPAT